MPRNINYPGYQTGGSTSNFDANEDRVRYYEELMNQKGMAYGGIIGLQAGGRHVDPYYPPGEGGPPGPLWRAGKRVVGGIGSLVRGAGRGAGSALDAIRGIPDWFDKPDRELRDLRRAYDLARDEEHIEMLNDIGREDATAEFPFLGEKTVFDGTFEEWLDATGALQSRASGGIIGLQQGGPAPQMSQVTSYGVPQQTARQWAGLTDRIVAEGQRPYQQYGGQRFAGFTQPEAAAMAGQVAYGQGMGPMGTRQAAQTLGQAGQMIGGAQQGLMSLQPQYAQMAGQFGAAAPLAQQQAQQAALGMGQLAGRAQLQGQLAGAGMRQTGTAGQLEQRQLGAGQAAAGTAAQAQQQQLGAEQQRRGAVAQTQMQGLGQQAQQAGQVALGAQQGFGTGMTGMGTAAQTAGQTAQTAMGVTGTQAQTQAKSAAERMRTLGAQAPELQRGADLSQYMSQYTAGVTDPQLQQLMEFQRMQGQELKSTAAQQGAYGGSRMGVQAAEQAKAASQQAADIIGKGQQEAFQSAQAAFQADRAAQQQAQQTGLSAEQQAAATQAGAQGQALAAQQAGIGALQTGGAQQMQAQQQAAGMADVGVGRQMQGLQAQVGATGQGIQFGQQGLEAQRAAEQVGAGQEAQALAAQRAAAQAGVGMSQAGQQQGFQAAQAGTQLGLGALQAAQGARQQGWGTYGQMLGQQQGAIGAQGQLYSQMGGMGGQLAGVGGQQMQLGAQEQQQQFERLRGMEGAGEKQRAMMDRSLGMGYQDWQNQLNQERSNIGWQQAAMSGLPYQGTVTQSKYAPQMGSGASAMATGIGAMGLYNKYQQNQQRGQQQGGQQPWNVPSGFAGPGVSGGQPQYAPLPGTGTPPPLPYNEASPWTGGVNVGAPGNIGPIDIGGKVQSPFGQVTNPTEFALPDKSGTGSSPGW